MNTALRIALMTVAITAGPAFAQATNDVTPVPIHSAAPVNKLRMKAVMNFPADVKTVLDVAHYLLEPAGYKLANSYGPGTRQILSRPLLPHVNDKSLMAIDDALLLVSGDDTRLVVDHANKLVTLENM